MSRARHRRVVVALGLAIALALASCAPRTPGEQVPRLEDVIKTIVSAEPSRRTPPDSAATWTWVREFYEKRHHHAAWLDGSHPRSQAEHLVAALAAAGNDGLEPRQYEAEALGAAVHDSARVWSTSRTRDVHRLARLDVRLTTEFLRYATHLARGHMPDSTLDVDWLLARKRFEPLQVLERARKDGDLTRLLTEIAPSDTSYLRLRDVMVRYRAIADGGGWPTVSAGPALGLGDRDARVAAVRAHLRLTGDLQPGGGDSLVFDRTLRGAVTRFQRRHALRESGKVDSLTRAALNVPVAERERQIAMNLERLRWLPMPFSDPYVAVNIPDFTLQVRDSGSVVLRMRVVVGERRNPTPVFSDEITYIDFNPTWRVPPRILVEEVAKAQRRDTSYLARNHMRVFYTHTKKPYEVPHTIVNWYEADQDTFPYMVVQDGGDENPLGRMKFMCPNEYDVYLHDTPAKGYFQAGARDKSHGCIRVEKPWDFAQFLLKTQFVGARDSVDSIVSRVVPRRMGLRRRIPVHVQYWTAWVDSAGTLQFRDDIYGIDRRLGDAIDTGREAWFVLNPPLTWREDELSRPALTGAARRDSLRIAGHAMKEAKRWDDSLRAEAKRVEDSLRVEAKHRADSLRAERKRRADSLRTPR